MPEVDPPLIYRPSAHAMLVSKAAESDASLGTKGAMLAALPPAWTPDFVILTTTWVAEELSGALPALDLPAPLQDGPLIVRSSIVGERIWDRGTFLSIALPVHSTTADIRSAVERIHSDAQARRPGAKVAVIVQRLLLGCQKGVLGNLNSLSKTREHWARFSEYEGFQTAPQRFNSQRDVRGDTKTGLRVSKGVPVERVFGSACRWLIDNFHSVLGRDRFLLEWAIADDAVYILQCDLDEDHPDGVDPSVALITASLSTGPGNPAVLKVPDDDDISKWDKLKILEDLSTAYDPLPQVLYLLSFEDGARVLKDSSLRDMLANDLNDLFGPSAVVRVSRKSGSDRTTNLPCTSSCMDPVTALGWIEAQLADYQGDLSERAFILHRYIGARAGAWALFDPDSPYIQVHANWGLPDALQYYPYDAWDVHGITEEITSYPSYKSHFLWPSEQGDWEFKEILNSIGRHQCLGRVDVLDVARRTQAIGAKLGSRVAIMWFVGVETDTGGRINLPWYRTYDYSVPDLEEVLERDHVIMTVRNPPDLTSAGRFVDEHPGVKLALDIRPSEHLVREKSFLEDIINFAESVSAPVIYSGSPLSHPYFLLHGRVRVFLRLHRKSFRTRSRIKYHKLVRDKIPERIKSKHERVVYAHLSAADILQLLTGKLIEEAQELVAAEGEDATAEELADVYEVLRGMMHQAGVDEARVVEIANEKRERVGGFDRGIFLLETSLPKPGEATVDVKDVDFDGLVREEYAGDRVRVPFSLLGRLSMVGDRSFRIPGTDKAVRLSAGRDGIELSLEQLEHQLELSFVDDEEDDEEPDAGGA